MYEVILSPETKAFYAAADPPLARKLVRCFAQLEQDPRRHNNIKRLTRRFAGYYRYRVGDWRVAYSIVATRGRFMSCLSHTAARFTNNSANEVLG